MFGLTELSEGCIEILLRSITVAIEVYSACRRSVLAVCVLPYFSVDVSVSVCGFCVAGCIDVLSVAIEVCLAVSRSVSVSGGGSLRSSVSHVCGCIWLSIDLY